MAAPTHMQDQEFTQPNTHTPELESLINRERRANALRFMQTIRIQQNYQLKQERGALERDVCVFPVPIAHRFGLS